MSASDDQALVLAASPLHTPSRMSASPDAEKSISNADVVPAKRPFTYNNGYGDFCFLRLVDGYPKPSIGAVDTEFVREGTFPFMKLPREIRDEIYKLVLAPLLCRHNFSKGQKSDLVLLISKFEDKYYEKKAERLRNILHPAALCDHIPCLDPQQRSKFEEEEEIVTRLCTRFLHPTRGKYEITFPIYWGHPPDYPPDFEHIPLRIPPVLLASIRNLSNVSCQIRQELATCAWARSFLGIKINDQWRHIFEGLVCLKERPTIWKGLKTILLEVYLWCCDSKEMSSILVFMNQHLQLDLLIFKLKDMDVEEDLPPFLEAPTKPKWVHAMQELRCTQEFRLILQGFMWTYHMRHPRVIELENMLMPLVLRGREKEAREDEHELGLSQPNPLRGFSMGEPSSLMAFECRLQADGSFEEVSDSEGQPEFELEKYKTPPPSPRTQKELDDSLQLELSEYSILGL